MDTLCFNVWIPLLRKETYIKNTCILWSHRSNLASLWTIKILFLILILSYTQYPYIHTYIYVCVCVYNFIHGSIFTLILLVVFSVMELKTLRTWNFSVPLQKKCWILNKIHIHHRIPLQQSWTWTLYWINRTECPYCVFIFLEKSKDGFLSLWFYILIWKLDN